MMMEINKLTSTMQDTNTKMVMTAIAVDLAIVYHKFRVKVKILKKWLMIMIL